MRRSLTTTRLGVQQLEARDVPSVYYAGEILGTVHVYSNNANSNVSIFTSGQSAASPGDWVRVIDTTNGFDQWIQCVNGTKGVAYHGGSGADTVNGKYAFVPQSLDGGAGNDNLTGGSCNDNLFGRGGVDSLSGGAGSDFLDAAYDASGKFLSNPAGSPQEVEVGGEGYDFYAGGVVYNGIKATDVHQGASNNCWIMAPLADAAAQGYQLQNQIKYAGNGHYSVKLFHPGYQTPYSQDVSLLGGRKSFEPGPVDEESWVILFSRAIAQQQGIDWQNNNYPGGITKPNDVMSYLTNASTPEHFCVSPFGADHFQYSDMVAMHDALAAGLLVCAGTRPGDYGSNNFFGDVTTPKLVGDGGHVYAVTAVNLNTKTVTLYNPWGTDVLTDSKGNILKGQVFGANDGIVAISFDQFYGSFQYYAT
jgi:Calpain family cysteine protease/RTX calcium-binding nonapeptide repeat (4 copies)